MGGSDRKKGKNKSVLGSWVQQLGERYCLSTEKKFTERTRLELEQGIKGSVLGITTVRCKSST